MVRDGWEAYRRWRKGVCGPDFGQVGLGLAPALRAPSGMSSEVIAPVIVSAVLLPPCHPLPVYCVLAGFSVTNCLRVCIGLLENYPCMLLCLTPK
jgi:hypothetical protein